MRANIHLMRDLQELTLQSPTPVGIWMKKRLTNFYMDSHYYTSLE